MGTLILSFLSAMAMVVSVAGADWRQEQLPAVQIERQDPSAGNVALAQNQARAGTKHDVAGRALRHEPQPAVVRTGAQKLAEDGFKLLAGKRVGLITNHTAVSNGRHTADLLAKAPNVKLVALFAPEHGIRGDRGGSIENQTDSATGLPIYSLYGATRKPTAEMLKGIDVLVYEIQDIGPRFYTYISTLGMAMEAAAEHGLSFVVLDRPNPLGGELVEGFVREPEFKSFIAYYPIPVTHGMTIGELALMAKGEKWLEGAENLDLHVVKMEDWHRNMLWPDTKLAFIRTSPNIPDFETALIYPGACFWERVAGSTGRGTPQPFIQVGAEWADGKAIAEDLNSRHLPGLRFEEATFTPTGRDPVRTYHGIRHVVTDARVVQPVAGGMHVLQAFYKQSVAKGNVEFLRPMASHAGTNRLNEMLTKGASAEEIIASWGDELRKYDQMRRRYFLYD